MESAGKKEKRKNQKIAEEYVVSMHYGSGS